MKVGACLMFSTLGPDTFRELTKAWENIDNYAHVNLFTDMHNIGDILLQEYFLDPVVDAEYIYVHYSNILSLLESLKIQGVKNINKKRRTGLMGKEAFKQFKQNFAPYSHTKFQLTYEVIYGQAWKGTQRRTVSSTETVIAVEDLLKSRK